MLFSGMGMEFKHKGMLHCFRERKGRQGLTKRAGCRLSNLLG